MCLSVAIARPDDVLATGIHEGYEWQVVHNGLGYRCGYVRLPKGHPWHGKSWDEIDPFVHGGITFAEPDVPCGKGDDDAWWIGFDCAHGGDAIDPKLDAVSAFRKSILDEEVNERFGAFDRGGVIRDQDYVENECRNLIDQCKEAAHDPEAHIG